MFEGGCWNHFLLEIHLPKDFFCCRLQLDFSQKYRFVFHVQWKKMKKYKINEHIIIVLLQAG